MPLNFDPQGALRTPPAYMQQGGGGGFADPMTLALLGASAGFLDPHGGMMGGFQGALQGMQAGNQMKQLAAQQQMSAMKLQKQMEVQDYLKKLAASPQASDPVSMGNALINSGHQELMTLGANLLKSKTAKSFLKGLDQNGNPTYYTGYSTGEVSPTGVTPAEKLMQVNEGNQITARNPYNFAQTGSAVPIKMSQGEAARLNQSAQQFGMSHGLAQENSAISRYKTMMEMNPEFLAQKAGMVEGAKVGAKNQAQAKLDLPQVIQQGEHTIKLVDDILNHPGFNISVGAKSPAGKFASFFPGTDAASFDIAQKQMVGKQFLEAFESLKGGGQITQIEGEKATQAMSRMNTSNTQEEYKKAAKEFQDIIRSGINRAKQKAGVQSNTFSDGWGDLK